jgi:Cu(I)/Ag(I) efflux system membrane protein CusA/SilA
LLTLIVIPAIFGLIKEFRLPNGPSKEAPPSIPIGPARHRSRTPEPAE